ncbi:diamine N-acetyltransferase [Lentibacillus persicus]|uniref:Diamine N-acetyltransferase n=1 Tax=Lentibacillus persicus TaxID=640948 RepID=A0A1I2AHW7_9BACI|nr:diamine N-acetyltransferase [Lentibacillus persicus]
MRDKNKDNQDNREFMLTNSNEEKLGFVSLYDIENRHRNAEFAIIIDPLHQGNGYAAPGTVLAMEYAFSVLNLHKAKLQTVKRSSSLIDS